MSKKSQQTLPEQEQGVHPGNEAEMTPKPEFKAPEYKGSGKLKGKVALITGGDSGIGRSVAVLFAREGAQIAVLYLSEEEDAEKTRKLVQEEGQECVLIKGDVAQKKTASKAVAATVKQFGGLNVLINNAAIQVPQQSLLDISEAQLDMTFRTNIYGYFFMAQAALPHLLPGDVIINTTSVTAYRGSHHLLDYSATKGAIVTFTRSLALNLAETGIRVNGVAPGPVWTPLIPSSFDASKVKTFGGDVPLGRPGQPEEIAPAYVYLASSDSTYVTGQVLHPNGGEVVNA